MLDIRKIIENVDLVRSSIRARGVNVDVDELLRLHTERKSLKVTLDNKRSEANVIAKKIPALPPAEKQICIAQGRTLNTEITALEEERDALISLAGTELAPHGIADRL